MQVSDVLPWLRSLIRRKYTKSAGPYQPTTWSAPRPPEQLRYVSRLYIRAGLSHSFAYHKFRNEIEAIGDTVPGQIHLTVRGALLGQKILILLTLLHTWTFVRRFRLDEGFGRKLP